MITNLPRDTMSVYFNERDADPGYKPPSLIGESKPINNDNMIDVLNSAQNPMNNKPNPKQDVKEHGYQSEQDELKELARVKRGPEIIGKSLKEFELCVGHDLQSVPLIFHILVGFFQHNPEMLKTEGLFRVAAKDQDV